jgi:hypothetical protein
MKTVAQQRCCAPLIEGRNIFSSERWGPFTETVPAIARAGTDFVDISGNDEIAATIVGPKQALFEFGRVETLFRSRVLSDERLERRAVLVPVVALGDYLRALETSTFELEHLYDY